MKIRQGFVSNSSSSSFVVHYINDWNFKYQEQHGGKRERLIWPEQIKQLELFGFVRAWINDPWAVEVLTTAKGKGNFRNLQNKKGSFYIYRVDCNQNEPTEFLVWNNIPFKAAIHYGQDGWFYERDSDHVIVLPNFGLEWSMYGKVTEGLRGIVGRNVVRRIPITEFISSCVSRLSDYCLTMSDDLLDEEEKRLKILYPDDWRDFTDV